MSHQSSTLLFLLPPSVFVNVPGDAEALAPTPCLNQSAEAPEDQPTAEPSGSSCQSTCHACNIGTGTTPGFASLAEQRAHFKTDWHRFNIKRALARQSPLSETEFAALLDQDEVPDTVQGEHSATSPQVGSISGSDTEDEEQAQPAQSSTHLLFGPPLQDPPPMLHRAVWRAIIPDQTQPALPQLTQLHERGCRWGVVLSSGGHFAAAVVEARGTPKARGFTDVLTVLAHKTYHRYVVRAKAGGRQSSKDATGKYAKSAGSQIRRHNEVRRTCDIGGS